VLYCDSVCLLPPIGTSDHAVVSLSLCVSLQHQTSCSTIGNQTRPNYAKADWSSICCFLSAINCSNVFCSCTSTEEYWDAFVSVIDECVNNFVPHFRPTVYTTNVKHYPSHIRKLLLSSWKLYRQFRSKELLVKYKEISQLCSNSKKY